MNINHHLNPKTNTTKNSKNNNSKASDNFNNISSKFLIDIDVNIIRNNIKSAEDFLNKLISEKTIELDNLDKIYDDLNKKYSIKEFSLIINYLNSTELRKILVFTFLNFENTTYLNLTANDLTFIPREISNLQSLETLILNNNKINIIENLENIRNLKRLELRCNKVKEFIGLGNKPYLKTLSVSCNLLEKIEEENFYDFPCLQEIGLFGNFLGDEKNPEENLSQLDKLLDMLSRKAANLSSIYLGGNHFLHLNQTEVMRKISEYKFKNLSKLDGQNLN